LLVAIVALALCTVVGSPVSAVDVHDTRMLAQPAISDTHIAFVYAGDLWSAELDGGNVRRLTTHRGVETRPRFSPDGNSIAFSGQYDGNLDVYVVAVEGGVPQRLTWHPGGDMVQDWEPDGSAVLFSSGRSVHTNRYTQLFKIGLDGGMPEKLPIPYASKASISPDGTKISYTPLRDPFEQWKNYRGGTATWIWLYDRADHSVVKIPQPEGRSNDTDPMWIGDMVYFRSDRNGEFNLFSYDPATDAVEQLTFHDDYPVANISSGSGRIIYEQAGYLHTYQPGSSSRQGAKLTVGVPADLIETMPRWVDGADYIRNADISPSGARAVFEYRGEIITLPAKKGDARNLTDSTGAHERSPVWSPDLRPNRRVRALHR
jgi:tricorn protease